MDIYVQSCGLHPKQDYCWLKIIETGDRLQDNPPLLVQVKDKNGREGLITDFYYSEAPSIVLARGNSKSILVITALVATDRSKIYGRTIRNSLAIITDDTKLLKTIADRASQHWDDFRHQIDLAVKFDEESGFNVDLPTIKSYIKNITPSNSTSDKLTKIIQVTDLNIAEEELKKKNRSTMIILQVIVAIAFIAIIVFLWAKQVN